jgi:hypothetical protein
MSDQRVKIEKKRIGVDHPIFGLGEDSIEVYQLTIPLQSGK